MVINILDNFTWKFEEFPVSSKGVHHTFNFWKRFFLHTW